MFFKGPSGLVGAGQFEDLDCSIGAAKDGARDLPLLSFTSTFS